MYEVFLNFEAKDWLGLAVVHFVIGMFFSGQYIHTTYSLGIASEYSIPDKAHFFYALFCWPLEVLFYALLLCAVVVFHTIAALLEWNRKRKEAYEFKAPSICNADYDEIDKEFLPAKERRKIAKF